MSNLLTPPREPSAVDNEDIGTFHIDLHRASSSQSSALPTPVSPVNMDLACGPNERPPSEHRAASVELDDQDMSDGGAPLMATPSRSEEPTSDHGPMNSQILASSPGSDTIFLETDFGSTINTPEHYQFPPSQPHYYQSGSSQYANSTGNNYTHFNQGATHGPHFPSALQLSQYLYASQASTGPYDQAPGYYTGQGSASHLPVHHYPDASGEPSIVSLAQSFAFTSTSLSLVGAVNAPHLWNNNGAEGTAPSPTVDPLFSGQDLEGIFPSSSSQDAGEEEDEEHDESQADQNDVDEQFNLSLGDFLDRWGLSVVRDAQNGGKKRSRGPDLASVREQSMEKMVAVKRSDLEGDRRDIQGINWTALGVSRLEAKQMRRQTYKNYCNIRGGVQGHHGAQLSDHENYFRFRKMDFEHNIHLSHFQLRNLLVGTSRDNIFYAGRCQVLRIDPSSPTGKSVVLDLTDPVVQPFHPFPGGIQISTLTAAHNILVAGGFSGEYGLTNLRSQQSARHAEGIITDRSNSITNHVQVHLSRSSSLPLAAFASNDCSLRLLDITTNKFIKDQKFDYAINCSVISPDERLRVLVGDTEDILICNSESGQIIQRLTGHKDFGFACDWADDGWTVATGNQDMQIKIWDARKWTDSFGNGAPITTIAAEMAGVRKLKFSPVGSGKRVLIAAEPADFINVIDAETFDSKQTLSFFGEIGGLDFTNNGQDLIVANCDGMRGGIMEFERCNLAAERLYELDEYQHPERYYGRERRDERDVGLDWRPTLEEVVSHPKAQRTITHRKRKAVNMASMRAY